MISLELERALGDPVMGIDEAGRGPLGRPRQDRRRRDLLGGKGMLFAMRWKRSKVLGLIGVGLLVASQERPAVAAESDFSLDMKIDCSAPSGEARLVDAGSFYVQLREAGAHPDLAEYDSGMGNYVNFPMTDGGCPVIEAVVPGAPFARVKSYADLPSGCRVGVPLGVLTATGSVHDVCLTWRKTSWRICVDGQAEDVDFLVEPLPRASLPHILSPRVRALAVRPAHAAGEPASRPIVGPIQYWTGPGFNTWVGDVTVISWRGRLHLFYLQDRRHHRSKGSSGGHYFAHISSADLVRWDEHPIVTPIEDYWFTCGTGTPFVHDGRLCLAYGIHSTRYVSREATTEPRMLEMLRERGGVMPSLRFAGTDMIPLGATWASSEDGFRFEPSGIVFHTTQNPAIENLPDGTLRLTTGFAGDTGVNGVWRSKTMTDWRRTDERSPLSGDCPCPFSWNGWRYLLQGFKGYAYAREGAILVPHESSDVYDGLSVPMVATWQGNRRILAGWLAHPFKRGWGGWLVFRELVQRSDGTIGTRFVPEIAPPSPIRRVTAQGGVPLRLRFKSVAGGALVEFGVDPASSSAYLTDVLPNGSLAPFQNPRLFNGSSFRVTNVRLLERDYAVRYVMHYDQKAGATVFDFEIAGNRTLVVRRVGAFEPLM